MNTRISVIKSHKSNDNLLILTDPKKFDWANSILSEADIKFLKSAAKSKVPYIFIPKEQKSIIVQFLESPSEIYTSKEEARTAGNEILSLLSHYKIKTVTICDYSSQNRVKEFVEGMMLGNYQFLKYFKDYKERKNTLQKINVEDQFISKKEMDELMAIISATCKARDLVNEPQSYLSAVQLSKEIRAIGKAAGFKVTVFDKKKIQAMKMGGLLAVNMGSMTPPTFNIMEWKPKNAKNRKPVILVGKGIVYDTGGMSLKPTAGSMDFMKSDMAGAATVIGAIAAVASAKLPLHIVGLVPSTDNRPGNKAYVPGDVITMYNGSTVEVLNTDAEGRLVLADALHYAKRYKPELVMDFATLTGAAVRACGQEAICYMGTVEKEMKEKMEASGFDVHERLIEFPLWKEFGEQLKSNIADLKNLGGPTAGMITAGKFLEHFTDYPWMHFDIAGPAYLKAPDSYRTKEGTGTGVRLVFNFLKKYAEK